MECPADMRKWSTGKTFCQQVVILVDVRPSKVGLFKCSTHFVQHHSFVTVTVILWKLTSTAPEDVALERFLNCRTKTLGRHTRV